MKGSEFVAAFGRQNNPAVWEAAALELERSGRNMKQAFVPITLTHKDGRKAVVEVMADYFSVGEPDDFIRLPLTPATAQKIANLTGALLPTPRLVYRTWQQAPVKLERKAILSLGEKSNDGASFRQYMKHEDFVKGQLAAAGVARGQLISGHKKDVVVGNAFRNGKVLIFGWYKPSPDVFDDGTAVTNPNRQPQQPYSNVHGDFYVDYSHGARFVAPFMTVDGQRIETEKVYTDANLSDFVSHEGPVKVPRYPSGGSVNRLSFASLPSTGYAQLGAQVLIAHSQNRG